MTKLVVDAGVVLHLASEGIEVSDEHKLLAPTLLRSQALSLLHEAVHRGEISAEVAREHLAQHLARIGRMPIRLLGDAVLRRRAWDLADRLGWSSTYDAEYPTGCEATTAHVGADPRRTKHFELEAARATAIPEGRRA